MSIKERKKNQKHKHKTVKNQNKKSELFLKKKSKNWKYYNLWLSPGKTMLRVT